MPRDFWQTFKKVLPVGKTNKTVTIPAFSEKCGYALGSIFEHNLAGLNYSNEGGQIDLQNQFTIDFYVKLNQYTASDRLIEITGDSITLSLTIVDIYGLMRLYLNNSTDYIDEDINSISLYEWHRITVTFDYSVKKLNLYVDSILVKSSTIANKLSIFDFDIVGNFYGNLSEFKILVDSLSQEEITFTQNKRYSRTNVVEYWRLNNLTATGVSTGSIAQDLIFSQTNSNPTLSLTDYPPLKYGASYIVAEFPILTTTNKISLKYPIKKPTTNCNFCLCVRWIDINEIVQRRKFWTVGEKVNPSPEYYQGETLYSSPVLEIWNIDGNSIVDLVNQLVINTSMVSKAQSSKDHDITSLETIVKNTSLWAAFPWSNPQTFNEANPF
jgi:hypothetical protein